MSYRSAASVAFPGCCYCKAFSLRMQKERSVRLLLKGLVGMALVWLVIGFGMELFFLADRVHPALRVIVGLGMLFLMIMIAGGMCRSLLSRKKTSWRSCLRRYICGGFMIIQNNELTCRGMFSDQRQTEISLLLNYYENQSSVYTLAADLQW